MLHKKISRILLDKRTHSQNDIRTILTKTKKVDRAILIGYLRCMWDMGHINGRRHGRTNIYANKGVKI